MSYPIKAQLTRETKTPEDGSKTDTLEASFQTEISALLWAIGSVGYYNPVTSAVRTTMGKDSPRPEYTFFQKKQDQSVRTIGFLYLG